MTFKFIRKWFCKWNQRHEDKFRFSDGNWKTGVDFPKMSLTEVSGCAHETLLLSLGLEQPYRQ